jgi:hypothetical protein
MRTRLPICVAVGLLICATGCANRTTVIDSQADIIRTLRPVKVKAAIYQDGKWTEAGKVEIPAGWYCGPGPLPE